jgi:tripartite-type tricarboxylate transporter receptor subunit TctC
MIKAALSVGLVLLALTAPSAMADQPWPGAKPIRIIVPAGPGGPPDLIARALGDELAKALGQAVIVENRVGGGHVIGTEAVARSEPDGYTFLMASTPHVVNPGLLKSIPYDTQKDFAPITQVSSLPLVMIVNNALPAKSVKELVALAKAKPGQLNMASAGNGGAPHLAGELFKQMAGIEMTHVPYRASPQATTAIVAGEANLYFDTPSGALPQAAAGKVRALAVTSTKRAASAPDLPTVAEAGYPGYEFNVWNGFLAPAGTPAPIIARMHDETVRALALPQIKDRFAAMGIETTSGTPEALGKLIDSDIAKWRRLIAEAKITVD